MTMDQDDDGAGAGPGERLERGNPRIRKPPREPSREASAREGSHGETERLKRSRKRTTERLYVDPKIIPEGIEYEWKARSCYGKATDPMNWENLRENHWTEVPPDRHPGIVVEQDGLVLMQRPKYLSQEARQEDFAIAQDQARRAGLKVRETPQGQFSREHPSAQRSTVLNREYGPITIPET